MTNACGPATEKGLEPTDDDNRGTSYSPLSADRWHQNWNDSVKSVKHAFTSKVVSQIVTPCECDQINGNFSNISRAQISQLPHDVYGKGVLNVLGGVQPK